MVESLLQRCLLLDLEVSPDHRILEIGALRPSEGAAGVFRRRGRFELNQVLAELDRFAAEVDFVLGHNLLEHDLMVLHAAEPRLGLLAKPAIDTLYLSPLAFPKNPYHRLVKDYKLVRQSLNDPVADARLAGGIFREQWQSFSRMPRERLAFYAYCLGAIDRPEAVVKSGEGLATALCQLAERPPMERARALSYVATRCAGKLCRVELRRLAEGDLTEGANRLALAYVVAWLEVAGSDSVLPSWVRHRHPQTVQLLNALRETPCDDPDCLYCAETHDPRGQLHSLFGFERFRPEPRDAHGKSLQQAVTTRGLAGQPLLAILATGAGKSICYQLPALVRYRRRGLLTVVVSPLQALMKDQVDQLNRATGLDQAAALYGLLTPPERGKVLERVRLGEVAILYIAPEQLRNRSFRRVVEQREIACWVFDEAHCLSKWGHDFRPDYLYAARFINELAARQGLPIPPVACFTATAKIEVRKEVVDHFEAQLDQQLEVYESAVDRNELRFRVEAVGPAEKLQRIRQLLADHSAEDHSADGHLDDAGSAVIYFASRRASVEAATFLARSGIEAAAFHGGLKTPQKREVLEAFVAGDKRVVCATNAFGMGIDKSDVRLVVHADIPGSLESYLQEAGRAGRDRQPSDCVLLFDPGDIEKQFRLAASSQLTQRDIAQILRGLRRARRRDENTVVVTGSDLLRDETVATDFEHDWQAETKVRTAVAWLERAGLVQRDANETRVFQGKLKVASLKEARQRLDRLAPTLRLPASEQRRWLAILAALLRADPDDGLSADELAQLPEVDWGEALPDATETPGQKVIRTLNSLAETGFLSAGLQLTAHLKPRGRGNATTVYEKLCTLERAMVERLAEEDPEAEAGEWVDLSLRLLNQRLVDAGHPSTPPVLGQLLRSLAQDGKGLAASHGSLDLKLRSRHRYRVRLRRSWATLRELAARRRAVGRVLLAALLAKVPGTTTGKTLVQFSTDELTDAIRRDLALQGQIRDPLAAAERALLFLHEQKVILLQNGLAVFRQAMTIRVRPEAKGRRYSQGDFKPLAQHYDERVFQTHVMTHYAGLGLEKIRAALALVKDYFALGKVDFVGRYFPGQDETLARATSQASFREIVDVLANPEQMALVASPPEKNLLVLAGPGSGKTKVVVHRCAYLLRVERVAPRAILVLCFNRNAALELRRRLRSLVGDDARGVMVSTYHGLAMRLTGTSFAARSEEAASARRTRGGPDFDQLIPAAVRLLTVDEDISGLEAEELRDQILAGYSHILVDEYQDINQDQYDLVSAIAGRTEADRDRRLSIFAVGDDDQTIYGWSGARVEFIRRFQEDYRAEIHQLIDSYRSTAHILAAASAVIGGVRERLKKQAIRPDRARQGDLPGGRWAALDPAAAGRVQRLQVHGAAAQAAVLCERLFHMKHLDPRLDWNACAVLARRHADLEPIRSALESRGIPVAWTVERNRLPPLHRIREIARLIDSLKDHRREIRRASWLIERWIETGANPWWALAREILGEWREETQDAELPVDSAVEYLYEALAERSRETALGSGVRLATVHAAKGLEFPVVFMPDGGWGSARTGPASASRVDPDEERRLYYVGMTRAREMLVLFERSDAQNPFLRRLAGEFVEISRPLVESYPRAIAHRSYRLLGLPDLYLSFAGGFPASASIHRRLAALAPGAALELRQVGNAVHLCLPGQSVVAALSTEAAAAWRERLDQVEEIRVLALVERRAEDNEPAYRDRLRCDRWEVPIVEVVLGGAV